MNGIVFLLEVNSSSFGVWVKYPAIPYLIHVVVKGVFKCMEFKFLNEVILCFIGTLTEWTFLFFNMG